MASLMIEFVRPCIHGLLILMTIYYYPPPVFFLMEFILKFFDMEIALIVFDTIRCYPFFKFARRARRKVQLYPHTGLRIFPDCAVIFPARYCICTALILRNEFVHLFEGAFRNLIYARSHLTPQNFQEICACFLACIKSQIWDALSTYLCEGNYVCIFTAKLVRLLFPRASRGNLAHFQLCKFHPN